MSFVPISALALAPAFSISLPSAFTVVVVALTCAFMTAMAATRPAVSAPKAT